jgi:predicted transcriptional regulator of viral defense system
MRLGAMPYVEGLLARGRRTFTRAEAASALQVSPVALYSALLRLRRRGWLAMPRRGFFLIVDPAHRGMGALPPATWIDDLMRHHRARYYVGLLSAAAMHGASQQSPQEFQVVTNAILRPLIVGRVRIAFFYRHRMELAATGQMKTPGGPVPVSTPEMTAYDLVRYRKGAGSLDHAATVIAELAERMDAGRLLAIAGRSREYPVIQRLGYILERIHRPVLARPLSGLIRAARPAAALFDPAGRRAGARRNTRWSLLVNVRIEAEA